MPCLLPIWPTPTAELYPKSASIFPFHLDAVYAILPHTLTSCHNNLIQCPVGGRRKGTKWVSIVSVAGVPAIRTQALSVPRPGATRSLPVYCPLPRPNPLLAFEVAGALVAAFSARLR